MPQTRPPRKLIQVGLGGFGRRWLEVVLADPRWEYAALATRTPAVREGGGPARRAAFGANRRLPWRLPWRPRPRRTRCW